MFKVLFKSIFPLLLIVFSPVYSLDIIQLSEPAPVFTNTNTIEYYSTSNKQLEFNDVEKLPQSQFINPKRSKFNLGISDEIFWFHVKVVNNSPENNWVLLFDNPHVDYLTYYFRDTKGSIIEKKTGDTYPFKNREINLRSFGFYLEKVESVKDYYFRVQTKLPILAPIKFYPYQDAVKKDKKENLAYSIFIGFALCIFIYNILLFFITRESSYILYSIAILFSDYTILHNSGIMLEFVWSSSPPVYQKMSIFTFPMFVLFFQEFSRRFLNMKNEIPIFNKIMIFMEIWMLCCLFVFPFPVDLNSWMPVIWFSCPLGSAFVFVPAIYLAFKKDKSSILFLISWIPCLLASLYFLFNVIGWFSDFENSLWYLFFSISAEHLLLSSVIAFRSNDLKNENQLIQSEVQSTRYKLLYNRMDPHFLFNALNTVYGMVFKIDKKAAKSILNLADLYHFLSDDSFSDLIFVKNELEFNRKYLEIMKDKYGNMLEYSIDIHKDLLTLKIPPLILQPIVENSIKHGFYNGRKLRLEVTGLHENEKVIFQVIDNGPGIPEENIENALNKTIYNIKQRLNLYFKNVDIFISNRKSGGLITRMEFGFANKVYHQENL
ncbi:MAG: histidine kinase [Spirochaetia bacterium]|nr:histidine kinase [Spirochaetia bacterium]